MDDALYTLSVPSAVPSVTLRFSSRDGDTEGEALTLTLGATDSSQVGYASVHAITISDASSDHGNDRATASPIAVGFDQTSVTSASIHEQADADYFVFTVGDLGLLNVHSESAANAVSLSGQLLDASGNEIVSASSNTNSGNDFRFSAVLRPGTFYIHVSLLGTLAPLLGHPYALHAEYLPATDYDTNANGLIEIRTLVQLNAVRCDLDGDGAVASWDEPGYASSFPVSAGDSRYFPVSCPSGCAGYELMADLDFEDADGNGTADDKSRWAKDAVSAGVAGAVDGGWLPIGTDSAPYTATFDGRHHLIRHLFINRNVALQGLFGQLDGAGALRNLALEAVEIEASSSTGTVGSLLGHASGTSTILGCYATGSVRGGASTGGLVGRIEAGASIFSSYASVRVEGLGALGGFLSSNFGRIVSCYSSGRAGFCEQRFFVGWFCGGEWLDGPHNGLLFFWCGCVFWRCGRFLLSIPPARSRPATTTATRL